MGLNMDLEDDNLFVTDSGHLGTTLAEVKPGDVVSLLTGSPYPVILRQQGSQWICVGSAYVPRIMKGEAWPDDEDKLWSFELI
jgi:hypothetical protein